MKTIVAGMILFTTLSPVFPAGEEACLDCHSDPDFETLFVDPDRFRASVHADLTCSGCHESAAAADHPGPLPDVSCGACHDDPGERHAQSLHAARDGMGDHQGSCMPPGCADCHGTHDILSASDPDAPTFRSAIPALCGGCHGDQEFVQESSGVLTTRPFFAYRDSVHGRAVDRGETGAAVCTDCHGTHALYAPRDERSRISRWNIPATCGRCHGDQAAAFGNSIHGRMAARGLSEAPVCTDCHGIHSILPHIDPDSSGAELALARTACARCHEGERLAREFGTAAGRVSSYLDSYHGLARQLGSVVVANCASCHGIHEILPSADPRSMVHADNLPATCGQCHPGAGENFARGQVHLVSGETSNGPGGFALHLVWLIYLPLIVVTVGGMLLHNGIDYLRRVMHPPIVGDRRITVARLSLEQRLQHATLIVSFVTLVITGFALKYPDAGWVEFLHMGESFRRTLHRIAATMMLLLGIYHAAVLLWTRRGRTELRALLPRRQDAGDAIGQIAFNVGLRRDPPRCGRFRYEEKLEYWALVWGIIVMVVTGSLLWFENLSLLFLPKWALDVAAAIHLYEAWLATLAIIVWHLYFVMFRPGIYPMNLAWLTGRMPASIHAEEHPLETEI